MTKRERGSAAADVAEAFRIYVPWQNVQRARRTAR